MPDAGLDFSKPLRSAHKQLNDWWEEFRLFHRRDGKVVKEGDDLMSATRYALMMMPLYARTETQRSNFNREPRNADARANTESRL
jgi:hypothetical protein